ncbi:MAG: hypothetical protein ACKVYV_04690 [Limisphaerales bacterium]
MSARPVRLNWIAAPLALVLGALLVAVLTSPPPPVLPAAPPPASNDSAPSLRAADDLRRLFSPPVEVPWATNLARSSPFFTEAIRPPPSPVAPPPPTTIKVAMLYQGHMETSRGARLAQVRVGEAARLVRPGDEVAGGWIVAEIAQADLTVTNASGKTLKLPFRAPHDVEVPVK